MQVNFGDVVLATLGLFVWAALIWMFIAVFGDIFRRRDLSGLGKAGWVILIVVLPFLGALFYVMMRPPWEEQDLAPARAHSEPVSPQLSPAEEIEKATLLLTSGAITPAEFATLKQQALARNGANGESP